MARDQVTVDVLGEKKVVGQLQAYETETLVEVNSLISEYMKKVWKTARDLTEGQGSGREYSRPWGTHQASKPGEPPAQDTGSLRSTIRARLEKMAGLIIGKVLAGGKNAVDYAAVLEFGAQSADGIEPRPFMKPALKEHVDDFIDDLIEALQP